MTLRERLFALEHFGIKLGLDAIRTLVEALNRPDRAWSAVHVAGTNGKGSVTAMVELGLRRAGHRTGRYTSPHLDRIEERIAIDGRPVDAEVFDRAAADVLAVVDDLRGAGALAGPPTFFEVTTAVAFEIFRRAAVDAAVIEVGLGGRFDATNVLTPAVTAITAIAFDHERHLGSTLPAIAFEKAGIIKPGVPVVVGAQAADEVDAVIAGEAARAGAPVVGAGREHVASVDLVRGRATLVLRTPARGYPPITLGLNGRHQVANAVVAARTLEVCAERGLAVGAADVVAALADVDWPARLEWLQVAGRRVLIDAAHNPSGAEALADYLAAAGVAPLAVVLGVMKDKNVDAILQAIAPAVGTLVATEVASPRALPAVALAARARAIMPAVPVTVYPDAAQALTAALAAHPQVCVAGSIFLAGPLRARLVAGGATTIRDVT